MVSDRIIHSTYRYLPGASMPPSAPSPPHDVDDDIEKATLITHPSQEEVLEGFVQSRSTFAIQLCIVITFSVFLCFGLMVDGYIPGTENGRPRTYDSSARLWPGPAFDLQAAAKCGPNAIECLLEPSSDWFGVHCRSSSGGGLVRGGAPFYTADSHVCTAAIHAGVIAEELGGCFEVRLTGPQDVFNSTAQSKGFGWFPQSFEVRQALHRIACRDARSLNDIIVVLGFIALAVLWRVDGRWMDHIAAQWGFYPMQYIVYCFIF